MMRKKHGWMEHSSAWRLAQNAPTTTMWVTQHKVLSTVSMPCSTPSLTHSHMASLSLIEASISFSGGEE